MNIQFRVSEDMADFEAACEEAEGAMWNAHRDGSKVVLEGRGTVHIELGMDEALALSALLERVTTDPHDGDLTAVQGWITFA